MPKIDLSDEQVAELTDVLSAALDNVGDRLQDLLRRRDRFDADVLAVQHTKDVLLEILEVLEDA